MGAALSMRPNHLRKLVCECAYVRDIMHHVPRGEVARELERAAEHRADDHAEPAAPTTRLLGLGAVAVRLLRHVREVDAEAEHVAPVPLVSLDTVLARVAAERGAETLPTRHRASVRRLAVG